MSDSQSRFRFSPLPLTAFSVYTPIEEVRNTIQQAIGPHEDLQTAAKKRKLKWYGHVSRSSGLAKKILRGRTTTERGKKKWWEDNIKEWTGLGFANSHRCGEQEKMERAGCKVVSGAPTIRTGQLREK